MDSLKTSATPSFAKKPKSSLRLAMGIKEIIAKVKPKKIKNNTINTKNIFEILLSLFSNFNNITELFAFLI